MDFGFPNILEDIVVSIVVFLLGFFLKSIYTHIAITRPMRRIWGAFLDSRCTIIVPTRPKSFTEISLHSGFSDMKAASKVEALVSSLSKGAEERVVICEADFASDKLEDDIVLVGGPISNSLTKRLMQDAGLPLTFVNHTLVNTRQKKEYLARFDERNDCVEDYGLVIKARNPYNEKSEFMLIAGCYGYGTYAASRAITNIKIIKEILRKVQSKNLALVVSTYVVKGTPQKPKVVYCCSL
jgi:hypothetical protein